MILAFTLFSCGKNSNSPQAPSTPPPEHKEVNLGNDPVKVPEPAGSLQLKGFGVIREFGATDTAALFGLLSENGSLQILTVRGPQFLGVVRLGKLDHQSLDHLFLKSAQPMAQHEKQSLASQWKGAQVIYFEGYSGTLCTQNESQYNVEVSGKAGEKPFTTIFQFVALPNPTGNCSYQIFGFLTKT